MQKRYTFEIRWPEPFNRDWKKSGKTFETVDDAAKAMAHFLAVSFENDCVIEGRICHVP